MKHLYLATSARSKRIFRLDEAMAEHNERSVGISRLLGSGGMAAAGSVLGNVIAFYVALGASMDLPGQVTIDIFRVSGASVGGVLSAVVVYSLLERYTDNAARYFRLTALVVLIVSFAGPLRSGADSATIVTLSAMHVLTAFFCVWLIPGKQG